jgi:hypothetical protein
MTMLPRRLPLELRALAARPALLAVAAAFVSGAAWAAAN